jgi:hypothetical protein
VLRVRLYSFEGASRFADTVSRDPLQRNHGLRQTFHLKPRPCVPARHNHQPFGAATREAACDSLYRCD